jgi:hypothetical protein
MDWQPVSPHRKRTSVGRLLHGAVAVMRMLQE